MKDDAPKSESKTGEPKYVIDSRAYQEAIDYHKTRKLFLRDKHLKGTLSPREEVERIARNGTH